MFRSSAAISRSVDRRFTNGGAALVRTGWPGSKNSRGRQILHQVRPGRGRKSRAASAQTPAGAGPCPWAAVDRVGTSTPRSGGTVAVDGVADFDPPPTDLAQPQKRPTSATKRFCFSRPNECPQSDWTGWSLADGAAAAIAGTPAGHARYVPALRAADGQGTAELVWSTMLAGITECGIPARSLTDNGMVYTGRLHAFEAAFEANLRAQRPNT